MRCSSLHDVVRRMAQAPESVGTQIEGCAVFAGISPLDIDAQRSAGEVGAPEAVVAALRAFVGHVALEEVACQAIFSLAWESGGNQKRAAVAGGVGAVARVLARDGLPEASTDAALLALRALVIRSARNKAEAAELGVVKVVVGILKASLGKASLAEQSASALHALLRDDVCNQATAGQAGAGKLLVAAMRRHSKAEGLQAACAEALQNLVFQNAENQALAAQAYAVEAVLSAMRSHPGSHLVHEHACGALWNLIADHPANMAMAQAGSAEALVVKAIDKFPGHEGVQDNACGALSLLRIASSAAPDPEPAESATLASRAMMASLMGDSSAGISPFHRYKPPRKGFCTSARPLLSPQLAWAVDPGRPPCPPPPRLGALARIAGGARTRAVLPRALLSLSLVR
mmetsp:Transcript_108306/g.312034  ORF Transcript_108306/g.312034 Transcript_108306/m.312034 type:complete len:402 (+) Transcript_108306:57-1262(+)